MRLFFSDGRRCGNEGSGFTKTETPWFRHIHGPVAAEKEAVVNGTYLINASHDVGQQGQHDGQDGGPPNWTFEDVDTNGDGVISRDEARAKYGTDPMGNPVQDFDQRFDEVDANGSGDVDPAEHAAAQNDQGGDCGFKMGDNGSVMVSLPDGSERWLMPGEYTMNDDGSLTVNKDGEPDNGATITPPPCNDGGGSNN